MYGSKKTYKDLLKNLVKKLKKKYLGDIDGK